MQVSLETTSGLERRLTIVVPAADVDGRVKERLKDLSQKVRLDGFRPRKVPLKVVKRRYGESVRQEILSEVIRDSYLEAIEKQSLQPAGMPTVEPTRSDEGHDFEFTATFEVYPQIKLEDCGEPKFEKMKALVDQSETDTMIENLRTQFSSFETVNRPSADGDEVLINFTGTIDGQPFEGGDGESVNLILGSGSMIDGFESGLQGVMPGGERTLDLTFPEDYQNEGLRGKAVRFKVEVQEVREKKVPELNKDFFIKFGLSEDRANEENFMAEVRKNMERELSKAQSTLLKTQVMDYLLEINPIEIPKVLVSQEVETLQRELFEQIAGDSSKFEFKPNLLPAEPFLEKAERRVRLGLILRQMVEDQSVKIDDERVRLKIDEIAQSYEDPASVVTWYQGNKEMMQHVSNIVLEDQLMDIVLQKAEISEKDSTYAEVMELAANSGRLAAKSGDDKSTEDGNEQRKEVSPDGALSDESTVTGA